LSQWDRQAACTKPVPLGLGKVERDLSLSHGTRQIPTLQAFSCPRTSSIPTMKLVLVPLVPTCPTKRVYKAMSRCVLLCFIDPRLRNIKNKASSCPGIFSRTLHFYVASSPGSLLPYLLDGLRKLVGRSAIPARSCPGPVRYHWGLWVS